jgi:pimeloyl-ACP methyl ester carboxylesterase
MAEEPDGYRWWHVMAYVVEPFLADGELTAGLIHGTADRASFTCECHDAAVVYTTRSRVVCMSCGYTHLVLQAPLELTARDMLTADDWVDLFGPDGSRRHDVVDLAMVEFRDVENAGVTWQTDRWEYAARDFVFFTRTPPNELAEAIKRTGMDGSVLAEAGFEPSAMPPTPASQLREASIDLDLISNAGHAFGAGVAAYHAAYTRPERLSAAVLDLFRAIELLLKARLEQVDPRVLNERLSNPTVLRRLADHGVVLAAADHATISSLRQLRNKVQHSEARFNHRVGLGLCRAAIIFIDAFATSQLGLRTQDAVAHEDWQALLTIPEIAASARATTAEVLEPHRDRAAAAITACPCCGEEALLRPDPNSGASCVHCGHVPVMDFDEGE